MARYGKDQHGEKTYSRGYRNPAKKELASEVDFQDSWGHMKFARMSPMGGDRGEGVLASEHALYTSGFCSLSAHSSSLFAKTATRRQVCRGGLRGWRGWTRTRGTECDSPTSCFLCIHHSNEVAGYSAQRKKKGPAQTLKLRTEYMSSSDVFSLSVSD